MNIVVCVKQVPGTNKVEIDDKTGVLKRTGVPSKMNPFDLYALETALRIKQECRGTITVITMGPPQAKAIIRESYMIGADKGIILTDMKFAGSDVLATSHTLALGIRKIKSFDLVICGKQTTDGDTAQVGPAIAEHLNIPHVAWVSSIEQVTNTGLIVEQNMEDSLEVVQIDYPCLVTVEKGIYTPRLPSYLNQCKSKDWPVTEYCLNDLDDTQENNFGLLGSPTQVERIFQPQNNINQIIFDSSDTDCSEELIALLKEHKFI